MTTNVFTVNHSAESPLSQSPFKDYKHWYRLALEEYNAFQSESRWTAEKCDHYSDYMNYKHLVRRCDGGQYLVTQTGARKQNPNHLERKERVTGFAKLAIIEKQLNQDDQTPMTGLETPDAESSAKSTSTGANTANDTVASEVCHNDDNKANTPESSGTVVSHVEDTALTARLWFTRLIARWVRRELDARKQRILAEDRARSIKHAMETATEGLRYIIEDLILGSRNITQNAEDLINEVKAVRETIFYVVGRNPDNYMAVFETLCEQLLVPVDVVNVDESKLRAQEPLTTPITKVDVAGKLASISPNSGEPFRWNTDKLSEANAATVRVVEETGEAA